MCVCVCVCVYVCDDMCVIYIYIVKVVHMP